MDKIFKTLQLVIAVFMFLCTIVWGVAHTIMGTIGITGILIVLLFAYLMWSLVNYSWEEYQQEKYK